MTDITAKLEQWFATEGFGAGPTTVGEYEVEFRVFPVFSQSTRLHLNERRFVVTRGGYFVGLADTPRLAMDLIHWADAHPKKQRAA